MFFYLRIRTFLLFFLEWKELLFECTLLILLVQIFLLVIFKKFINFIIFRIIKLNSFLDLKNLLFIEQNLAPTLLTFNCLCTKHILFGIWVIFFWGLSISSILFSHFTLSIPWIILIILCERCLKTLRGLITLYLIIHFERNILVQLRLRRELLILELISKLLKIILIIRYKVKELLFNIMIRLILGWKVLIWSIMMFKLGSQKWFIEWYCLINKTELFVNVDLLLRRVNILFIFHVFIY